MPDDLSDEAASRRQLYAMLRDLRQVDAEIAEQQRWVTVAIEEAQVTVARLRVRKTDLEDRIASEGEMFLVGDSKHVDIPGMGRIQYVDHQAALRIADDKAFIAALGADERARLVEQRDHLKTNEAKAYADTVLKDGDGELIPGVERVPARREHSINLTASTPSQSEKRQQP